MLNAFTLVHDSVMKGFKLSESGEEEESTGQDDE